MKKESSPKIYSYVMPWDSGLAPNPFFDICTLALCKPVVRRVAEKGDWVVGVSEAKDGYRLIYSMLVATALSFAEYWEDNRFQAKKPDMLAKQQILKVGDNIYEPMGDSYRQHLSMHSKPDGSVCPEHYHRDLGVNNANARVLIANEFHYFGRSRRALPNELSHFVRGRGHRVENNPQTLASLRRWLDKHEPGRNDYPSLGNWP